MSRNCVNNLEANRRGANDGAGGFGIKIINRATAIGNMTISLTDPFMKLNKVEQLLKLDSEKFST
jgi:hypothetical protein